MALDDVLLEAEEKMIKTDGVVQHEFRGIRTGKASPVLVENTAGSGVPGVYFDGQSACYVGPITVPALEGHSARSVAVWALNPDIGREETLVSWAHRGGRADAITGAEKDRAQTGGREQRAAQQRRVDGEITLHR